MENIIKCKYAGDPHDPGCAVCNGITLVENDQTFEATMCGGYEAEQQEQPQVEPETPVSHDEIGENEQETAQPHKQHTVGITSVIRAESGVSREINGTWYKFMFSEERIVPEGCDIEAEKRALWESVNAEVDAQVDAVR